MDNHLIKKITKPLLYPLAIGVVAWEEAFYKPVKAISQYIEKNKIVHRVSDKIRNSHPLVAVGLLLSCTLPLLPFKIAGLYFIGHGYKALGMATFGLAKVIGSAISLQMFNLTEPAMRKNEKINHTLNWIFDKKDKIKHVLDSSEIYQNIKRNIASLKSQIKESISPAIKQIKNNVINIKNSFFPKKQDNPIKNDIHINAPVIDRIIHRVDNFYDTAPVISPQKEMIINEKEVIDTTQSSHKKPRP